MLTFEFVYEGIRRLSPFTAHVTSYPSGWSSSLRAGIKLEVPNGSDGVSGDQPSECGAY